MIKPDEYERLLKLLSAQLKSVHAGPGLWTLLLIQGPDVGGRDDAAEHLWTQFDYRMPKEGEALLTGITVQVFTPQRGHHMAFSETELASDEVVLLHLDLSGDLSQEPSATLYTTSSHATVPDPAEKADRGQDAGAASEAESDEPAASPTSGGKQAADTSAWPTPTSEEPDAETLEALWLTGRSIATDGCPVAPNATCVHGHPSWLLRLGFL